VKTQAQIEALERLAALDAELKTLEDELTREREALTAKKQHLSELDSKLARSRDSVGEMDRLRGDLMGELRQMSIQIDKSREKLSRCRTEREANAAQREVEELRKLYRDREIEIDKLTALVDSARGEIDSTMAARDKLASELGESEGDVTNRLGDVETQAKGKHDDRRELIKNVETVLYRRYELVRKRKGTALAHTDEGTCSECHMLLPPMLYQQLMRGEDFSQCPSCHRILYFRAATAEAQSADSQSSGP
jgi:predicted  nucleic acid-binding Zn-ribbon protein